MIIVQSAKQRALKHVTVNQADCLKSGPENCDAIAFDHQRRMRRGAEYYQLLTAQASAGYNLRSPFDPISHDEEHEKVFSGDDEQEGMTRF